MWSSTFEDQTGKSRGRKRSGFGIESEADGGKAVTVCDCELELLEMQESFQITAVIPTYNRGALVGRAIESALAQEYAPSEIIVVDDGSVDDTRKVLESYGDKVRCVYQANAGVSAARNRGVREAKCEWIAFLDSDDYWVPSHLRRIVNAIEGTRGEAALYFSDIEVSGAEGGCSYWRDCGLTVNGEWEFKRDAGEWALMRIQPMMLQASVISRMTYLEIGGLAEQLRTREDTLMFFKLALLHPACAVAGCGTVMNSDDSIRLTSVYDQESLVYCHATIFLYRELLASLTTIGRERRRFLTDSLGAAYFGISRVLVRQRRYWSAMRNLAVSCGVSPSVFGRELLGSLKRRVFTTRNGPGISGMSVGAKW
jgi:glycosyltransferase involved in cell wall biosynthesis